MGGGGDGEMSMWFTVFYHQNPPTIVLWVSTIFFAEHPSMQFMFMAISGENRFL
jgi:hypothetical protein